jgi:hypothetical protein
LNLTLDYAEQILAQDAIVKNTQGKGFYKGKVIINNIPILYTSYRLDENWINIGTYYVE